MYFVGNGCGVVITFAGECEQLCQARLVPFYAGRHHPRANVADNAWGFVSIHREPSDHILFSWEAQAALVTFIILFLSNC